MTDHRQLTRFDTVLQAVEFPALVTGLDTGLAEVNRDAFCIP